MQLFKICTELFQEVWKTITHLCYIEIQRPLQDLLCTQEETVSPWEYQQTEEELKVKERQPCCFSFKEEKIKATYRKSHFCGTDKSWADQSSKSIANKHKTPEALGKKSQMINLKKSND